MMYRLLIVLCLLLLCCGGEAQTPVQDSVKIKHVDSLLKKGIAIFYSNTDSSLYFTERALNYAIQNKLELQIGRAWHSMARVEVLRGNIETALKHLREAVVIFEKLKHANYEAKCYTLMATALSKIDNHKECIRLLLKAREIQIELPNKDGLRPTLVNLANSYTKINAYDKALEALEESKLYTKKEKGDLFFYYINAGIIQQHKKNYLLAKTHYDSCIAISQRYKMIDSEVSAITNLAELFVEMKNYTEATQHFSKAIRMARQNNLPLEESDALKGAMMLYEKTGDYKSAYYSQNRLKVISDSLFNIEKVKNISAVEARLKVSEKEKTIALQKLDMEKQAAEQEKSRKRIELLIVGTILLVTILSFTLYVYSKAQKQKREIEIQKTRAERLNDLNQKIFAVIAHDFKSPLITLNMLIDLLDKETISKEDLPVYSADVRHQLTQSGQILDNLLNWAKTELNLSPAHGSLQSNPYTVGEEVIKELEFVSSKKNIVIKNEIPPALMLKVPADILRIVTRNLLSNAVKYSFNNSSVVLGIDAEGAFFVKDSGSGIDESSINKLFNGTIKSKLGTYKETGYGLGLYITHELVQKFHGKIWVEKNQTQGTVFKFVLPLYDEN